MSEFGPRRDEVTGEWRRFHNEELNDLYCLTNIAWVIKSRDLKRLKIIGWRAKVKDRQEWNRIVEQTETHLGL